MGDLEHRGREVRASTAGGQCGIDRGRRAIAQRRRGLVEQDEPRSHLVRVQLFGIGFGCSGSGSAVKVKVRALVLGFGRPVYWDIVGEGSPLMIWEVAGLTLRGTRVHPRATPAHARASSPPTL